MLGDSTSVIEKPPGIRLRCFAAMTPAVSHPAVPPPTITIFLTGCVMGRGNNKAPGMSMRHPRRRSEEHTSELQSLMRISYAVFCLKKKTKDNKIHNDKEIK